MWKVRSSLAWRIARDFSRRSLGRLKSNTHGREGNPLPNSFLSPSKRTECHRKKKGREQQSRAKPTTLPPAFKGAAGLKVQLAHWESHVCLKGLC